jgi:NADPH-dependent glutamate synthase beta subunit-like oxidoreductase/dihydroorotate dehydrogenase/Pyruvate/2-oxoacid:ferredoxin oxidoreductase delta subunit
VSTADKSGATSPYAGHYMTDAQLRAELEKCEYCQERPCKEACPCHCSPTDFIKAVEQGRPSDFRRAAALIMGKNPLGGVCGLVCPDHHCMAACVHKRLDGAVDIPRVQAAIVARAKALGVMPRFNPAASSGKKVAIIGGGPAGLGAAGLLAARGHAVTILERGPALGGMCYGIPEFRLHREALKSDVEWLLTSVGQIEARTGLPDQEPAALLAQGFDAVVVATGLWAPIQLGLEGEEATLAGTDFLIDPTAHDLRHKGTVAVIGGGATAFDCAMTALERGAQRVEMICLENLTEMPLAQNELRDLQRSGVDVSGRTQVTRYAVEGGALTGLTTRKIQLEAGAAGFALDKIEPVRGSEAQRSDVGAVIVAIGNRAATPAGVNAPGVFVAGDCAEGPTTVVEASGAGKSAGEAAHAFLTGAAAPPAEPRVSGHVKSRVQIPGYNFKPVSLETDFFGRSIRSPFLLSAAPPTDGLEQMKLAYEAGWAGGIMKTAFDGIQIHIPSEYMFTFGPGTYANCDNVSGHSLERVCREIEQLVREWPDRLTIGSTGGPVSGDDEQDMQGWQSNTKKLEAAGAMAIEYSLSCPQGGDGTEGDIVSQNAALTAKIIEWIVSAGDGAVPKLFKLTGAVTSINVILAAIKEVLDRYPDKQAGVTLANTFPTLAFRPGSKPGWDEGVVVGMSGEGALNISYLSLACVSGMGVTISGNGGPMDYKAAADFLALGAKSVQFCTIAMKNGYGIIDDLEAGMSHLMADRGIGSVAELIGAALPGPITDFMELTPVKKISCPDHALCLKCGNCGRCPYLAISPDAEGYPVTDPERCVGCSICSLKCFAEAITMKARTPEQASALRED